MSNSPATVARWSKSHPSWGSAYRIQRNAYAYAVSMVLTEGKAVCPSCDAPMSLSDAEVDRVVPAADYCESNIVYLCIACNQGRAALQSVGKDWKNVDAYAKAVREASAHVEVLGVTAAKAWWASMDRRTVSVSRWA